MACQPWSAAVTLVGTSGWGRVVQTVRGLLRHGVGALSDGDGAREAALLLRHVLKASEAWLIAHANDPVGDDGAAAYKALIERRARGEPVAYLTGTRGFHALELHVAPDVLVPRPETELLVDLALARIPARGPDGAAPRRNPGQCAKAPPEVSATSMSPARRAGSAVPVCNPVNAVAAPLPGGYGIADLGTGSGAVALAIARARPDTRVLATDASDAALAIARGNARRLNLTNVEFRQGDWCAALGDASFDLIVSNPPYIAGSDPHLREGDLRFEPHAALASGADGLDAIRVIVRDGRAHLRGGGWLLFEHGFEQGPAVRELLAAHGYAEIFTERDLEGRERVSGGRAVPPSLREEG